MTWHSEVGEAWEHVWLQYAEEPHIIMRFIADGCLLSVSRSSTLLTL
jgi:hypothetical protein